MWTFIFWNGGSNKSRGTNCFYSYRNCNALHDRVKLTEIKISRTRRTCVRRRTICQTTIFSFSTNEALRVAVTFAFDKLQPVKVYTGSSLSFQSRYYFESIFESFLVLTAAVKQNYELTEFSDYYRCGSYKRSKISSHFAKRCAIVNYLFKRAL